jgi:hypothetical protein
MLREEPSADTILLIYLGGTVGILICFASLMYWMTHPTVLASPELAFIERTPPAASNSNPLFRSAYENEGLAIAVAEQENDRHQLIHSAFLEAGSVSAFIPSSNELCALTWV